LKEEQVHQLVKSKVMIDNGRVLGEMYPLTGSFDKSQFKIGSLNDLMQINEWLGKVDIGITQSLTRHEKLYFEVCKDLNQKDP